MRNPAQSDPPEGREPKSDKHWKRLLWKLFDRFKDDLFVIVVCNSGLGGCVGSSRPASTC